MYVHGTEILTRSAKFCIILKHRRKDILFIDPKYLIIQSYIKSLLLANNNFRKIDIFVFNFFAIPTEQHKYMNIIHFNLLIARDGTVISYNI